MMVSWSGLVDHNMSRTSLLIQRKAPVVVILPQSSRDESGERNFGFEEKEVRSFRAITLKIVPTPPELLHPGPWRLEP